MPIFEFRCRDCSNQFESLVRGTTLAPCPSCQSENVEKLLSAFAVSGDGTRDKALRAAKARDRKQSVENFHRDREIITEHHDKDDHH
jgi:putative FmdB family regulatory protein